MRAEIDSSRRGGKIEPLWFGHNSSTPGAASTRASRRSSSGTASSPASPRRGASRPSGTDRPRGDGVQDGVVARLLHQAARRPVDLRPPLRPRDRPARPRHGAPPDDRPFGRSEEAVRDRPVRDRPGEGRKYLLKIALVAERPLATTIRLADHGGRRRTREARQGDSGDWQEPSFSFAARRPTRRRRSRSPSPARDRSLWGWSPSCRPTLPPDAARRGRAAQ